MTYDGTNVTGYVDGTQVSQHAQSGNGVNCAPDGGSAIGSAVSGGPINGFDGTIDETGVWSHALSSAEVSQLYSGGTGLQSAFLTQNGVSEASYVAADANGDGVNDVSLMYSSTGSGPTGGTINSTQLGTTTPDYWAGTSTTTYNNYPPWERGVRFLDVNADGKADVVRGYFDSTNQHAGKRAAAQHLLGHHQRLQLDCDFQHDDGAYAHQRPYELLEARRKLRQSLGCDRQRQHPHQQ